MIVDPLERVWREERAAIVASLARRLGDLELAEDATQEAFATAALRWPVDGIPARPGAWLTTTAWRKAMDTLRRTRDVRLVSLDIAAASPSTHEALVAAEATLALDDEAALSVPDDVLRLIIACCHPALAPEARVALTLRHVAGLSAREIAAAFLVPEQTMEKRLVRARSKIRDARIPFELPDRDAFPARLADVQAVLYLIFSEGYASSGDGPPIRRELCDDAIWLSRQLHALVPHDMESIGLLALMLLHRARADARLDDGGQLLAFDEQDRSRWDQRAMAEARDLLARTGAGPLGPYQVEAAIALLHTSSADDPSRFPWANVAELYAVLMKLAPSPVVALNAAYARGRAEGAQAGLRALEPVVVEGALAKYVPLHVVHADLLLRSGSTEAAALAWRRAIDCATHPRQRVDLHRRAARVGITLPDPA